jgi:colanic acid biosynthesis glycosyl transferase WcaI
MSRQPSLVFVNRYYRPDESATSQMLTDLAERLAVGEIRVRVICSRQLYEDPSARLQHCEVLNGVEIQRVWTSRFGRNGLVGRALDYVSFYISAAVAMYAMLRPGDILVAKTDPPMISVVAAWVARARGAVLVNWLQDVFPEVAAKLSARPIPGWLYRPLRALRDRSLRFARVNVVLGERMAQHMRTALVQRERVRIIENWADGILITPRPPTSSKLRVDLGLERHFVAAYCGNLGRAHEFETVLEAAVLLHDSEDIAFLFVGGGAKLAALRRRVEELGLRNFRFVPHQARAQLADCLAAADVHLACLLPDLEGLIVPSKAYGVLAAGRPLISIGDTEGELALLVRAHQCGSAVTCGDAKALAAEILRLRSDHEQRDAMGRRARRAFEERYSLESAVDRWGDLLGSLHAPFAESLRSSRAARVHYLEARRTSP